MEKEYKVGCKIEIDIGKVGCKLVVRKEETRG